jgi:hypothetical protein
VSLTISKFHLPRVKVTVSLTIGKFQVKLTYGFLYMREMKLAYSQTHLRLLLSEGDETPQVKVTVGEFHYK